MPRRRTRRRPRFWLIALAIAAGAGLVWCRHRAAEAPARPPVRPASSPPPQGSATGKAPPAPVMAEAASPWASRAECERLLAAGKRLARPGRTARLATWNLRWFPYGKTPGRRVRPATDVAWVACAIAWMGPDAVALQEIVLDERGQAAVAELVRQLDRTTSGKWVARFDDCPGSGRQHVGLLVNSSAVEPSHFAVVAAINPGAGACDNNLRPGFGGYLRWPDGPDLHFVSVHLDSGPSRRDYDHRQASLSHLARAVDDLQAGVRDDDVVVAGDFNTMGCEPRGGCRPAVSPAQELAAVDTALGALATPFRRVPAQLPCTEYYSGKGHALDHFLLSRSATKLATAAQTLVQGDCQASACARRRDKTPAYTDLSDHCPVLLDLPRADDDP